MPSNYNPVYVRSKTHPDIDTAIVIEIHPKVLTSGDSDTECIVDYWKKPVKPKWGYVVVNEKALYNYHSSVDFDLHPMEEEPLVMRILELSGVIIQKPELQQTVMANRASTKQEQND